MRFWLGDIEVLFPYSFIYPEQYEYMLKLKEALDKGGTAVLEMPTGTGKTISLLALITSYQAAKGITRKLVYCSRTVTEIEKVVEEVKRLLAYRIEELGPSGGDYLCLALSSRKNLCIHPEVSSRPAPGDTEPMAVNYNQKTGAQIDSLCRDMTSPWAREDPDIPGCSWFEGFEKEGRDAYLKDVYSLEDLRVLGAEKGWCPYFLARHMASTANLVVFSYQYVLDPKIAKLICSQFDENTIVVFDEAHNIDTVCIDALSINVTQAVLDGSTKNLTAISTALDKMKEDNSERLKAEYDRLVHGLELPVHITEQLSAPVLGANGIFQKVTETVPGNMRKAEHFVQYLYRLLKYLKEKLRKNNVTNMIWVKQFKSKLMQEAQVNLRSLKFSSARLQSLVHTLQLKEISQFSNISVLCDFASLLGSYEKGFCLLVESATAMSDAAIRFCCLDASIAMKPVLARFHSVVITSGTLSPLEMFPMILDFVPVVSARFQMSLHRSCLCPLIVTKGGDQVAVTSKYEARKDPAVVRNYGNLLVDMAGVVPDGMVCFFPSYHYMESIVTLWNEMGILGQLLHHKLLFIETTNPLESTLALDNFRKAASSGRGAVLFSVARGKISEGIDFDHHYGRCVIVFGVPFVYTENRVLKERLKYLRDQYEVREGDFLNFDAMRTTAQCVGRIIRGKSDYGVMVFADKRYNRTDKRDKLPQWISQHLNSTQMNLSTDMAVHVASNFLREMAQPTNKNDELGKSLWTLQHVLMRQAQLEGK